MPSQNSTRLRHLPPPDLPLRSTQDITHEIPCEILYVFLFLAVPAFHFLRNIRFYRFVSGGLGQALPGVVSVEIGLDAT